MTEPNIQLGNLDYDSIKDSLKQHLQQQTTLLDYDYEGSALNVILDILAYNTLYYAFYSNMVANEMFLDTAQREESLISLVKPLGYVIPARTSARGRGKIRGGGANNVCPKYTRFKGINESGIQYNFYTLVEELLDIDGEALVTFAEGKSITKEQPLLIDLSSQKGFIAGLDIDISTITVEVFDDTVNTDTQEQFGWQEWSRAGNVETGLDIYSKVYWLERTELGFFIVFGGNLGSETTVQVGQPITDGQQIRITYLKSSGEIANGAGDFSIVASGELGSAAVDTVSLSSGGRDKPDLELIRFFAPKWFAAQDRAVTVEDCRAMLAKYGFVGGEQDPHEQFNIWGGETMIPPRYGRVFVSLIETAEQDPVAASTAIDILEKKTCITIIPEFINPKEFVPLNGGIIHFNPLHTKMNSSQLKSLIYENLTKLYPKKFEQTINASTLALQINNMNPALNVGASDITITLSTNATSGPDGLAESINFNNPCKVGSLVSNEFEAGSTIEIDTDYNPQRLIRLRIRSNAGINNKGAQPIDAVYDAGGLLINLGVWGAFFPSSGLCTFKKGLASEDFTLTVSSANQSVNNWNIKQNMKSNIGFDFSMQVI